MKFNKETIIRVFKTLQDQGYKIVRSDLAPTSQWQPMETAPKNAEILICGKHGHITNGHWSDYKYSANPPEGGGWFPLIDAVYWMSLPAPPTKDLAAEGLK